MGRGRYVMPRCPRTLRHCVANLFSIVTSATDFQSQVTRSFVNVAASLSAAQANSLQSVSSFTEGDNAVYLQCPNPGAAGNQCGKANRASNAYTGNKLEGNTFNTISFCDPFFDAGTSLAADKATYMKVPTGRRNPVRNTFDPPRAKGMRPFLQVKLQN